MQSTSPLQESHQVLQLAMYNPPRCARTPSRNRCHACAAFATQNATSPLPSLPRKNTIFLQQVYESMAPALQTWFWDQKTTRKLCISNAFRNTPRQITCLEISHWAQRSLPRKRWQMVAGGCGRLRTKNEAVANTVQPIWMVTRSISEKCLWLSMVCKLHTCCLRGSSSSHCVCGFLWHCHRQTRQACSRSCWTQQEFTGRLAFERNDRLIRTFLSECHGIITTKSPWTYSAPLELKVSEPDKAAVPQDRGSLKANVFAHTKSRKMLSLLFIV